MYVGHTVPHLRSKTLTLCRNTPADAETGAAERFWGAVERALSTCISTPPSDLLTLVASCCQLRHVAHHPRALRLLPALLTTFARLSGRPGGPYATLSPRDNAAGSSPRFGGSVPEFDDVLSGALDSGPRGSAAGGHRGRTRAQRSVTAWRAATVGEARRRGAAFGSRGEGDAEGRDRGFQWAPTSRDLVGKAAAADVEWSRGARRVALGLTPRQAGE